MSGSGALVLAPKAPRKAAEGYAVSREGPTVARAPAQTLSLCAQSLSSSQDVRGGGFVSPLPRDLRLSESPLPSRAQFPGLLVL